ncbi:MAG: ATP-binding cassette domain-containing protein [Chloroflexi bacterium]|jgi:ABC-2 type transport system ATP-binding protein|nr:ATP-binding cassette domain-containing protein [Chloroflexota bacterium]MBT3668643.1 ATP-binding cassette domain-containing protein [Chloroflexota bacterium]MBT4002014.1 ATP-binding cassette domain-containing protein [Chloroflexota bacterium]MBT4304146.1 ATP-binding cassette domain-containing protein [Chloroflexota bacterium]MBT4533220.1 ATP-binding cassette domain-containing protein [Chloroflexota bacterium]
MHTIDIKNISKRFGTNQAVKDISFEVNPGEIFGLLGPNGAGKTTCLRMVLDIFKPDTGSITLFGGSLDEGKKDKIGYMPEDRGLYQDIPLERCLTYLSSLKGMSKTEIKEQLDINLEKFGLADHRKKKVKELSKGMQQKAQIIATLQHKPELIIIDEPFTALDPINTQLIKDILVTLKEEGTTIIMCTHQMHQVEELCDRILLMNEGEKVLYGKLNEIRKQYSGSDVIIESPNEVPQIPGISNIEKVNGTVRVGLENSLSPQDLLQNLIVNNIQIEKFQIAVPSLSEIFIQAVTKDGIDE